MARRGGNPRISISADASGVKRGVSEAQGSLDHLKAKTASTFKETAKSSAGLALGAVGVSSAFFGIKGAIGGSIKAAQEAEKSQARLQQQLKASGISYKAHAAQIDAVIQKTSKLAGLDDEDLSDAFVELVRGSGSVNKSLKEMGLVADFARARHMDVAKAGQLVSKVMAGNTSALSRYGIILKPVTTAQDALAGSSKKVTTEQRRAAVEADKQASAQKALAVLQQRFSGQAEAYGKTTAGAVDRMHVAFENLGETVGGAVAPALGNAANKVADFVNGMQDGTGAGGKFADALDDIWQKAKPVVQFLKDHPKVIAGAIGAWTAYKVAARLASVAFKVSQFKANLAKTVPVAAEQGAASGRAYATSFDAASVGGIGRLAKGGKVATAMRGFGKALGLVGAAAMAYQFKDQIGNLVSDFLGEARDRINSTFSKNNLKGFAQGVKDFFVGNDQTNSKDPFGIGPGSSRGGRPNIGLSHPSTGGVGGFPHQTSPIKAPRGGVPRMPREAGGAHRATHHGAGHGASAGSSGKPPRKAVYTHDELMALWVWAGGPASVADTAAAIALAESGGRASIVNSIGATGLWQIYNGNGEVPGARDPYTNARMAVAKYRGAGNKFTPWTTFTGADTGPGGSPGAPTFTSFLTGGKAHGVSGSGTASHGLTTAQRKAQSADRAAHGRTVAARNRAIAAAKAAVPTAAQQFDLSMANADILDATPGYTTGQFGSNHAHAQLIRYGAINRRIKQVKRRLRKKGLSAATRLSLKQELASLLQQLGGLSTTDAVTAEPADVLAAGELPSGIGAAVSLAALTPDNADDISALTDAQKFLQAGLDGAKAAGDNESIIAFADALKGVNDQLAALNDKSQVQIELMQQQIDQEKERANNLKRALDVSQAQYPALMVAVVDYVNGALGRSVGAPRPLTATAVARL